MNMEQTYVRTILDELRAVLKSHDARIEDFGVSVHLKDDEDQDVIVYESLTNDEESYIMVQSEDGTETIDDLPEPAEREIGRFVDDYVQGSDRLKVDFKYRI